MPDLYSLLSKLKKSNFENNSKITYTPPVSTFNFCPKCGSILLKSSSKSIWCESCDFILFFNPAAAVAGIIIIEEKILFTIRKNDPSTGKLDLPGGFVDPTETAESAIKREIHEELGCNLMSVEYITSLSNSYTYKQINYNTLDMFFYCKVDRKEKIAPADDVAGYKLITIEKLDIDNDIGLESIKMFFRKLKQ